MLDNNLIQSTSSWPFVEIRKLLKDRKDIIKTKKKITFQTGYGPSGLPHIGTFGEVARTTMMINALNHIQKIDHELITFSDDMDGLRKVPENISNDEVLKKNLGKIVFLYFRSIYLHFRTSVIGPNFRSDYGRSVVLENPFT